MSNFTPLLLLVIRRTLSLKREIEALAIVAEPSVNRVNPRNLRLYTELAALLVRLTFKLQLTLEELRY